MRPVQPPEPNPVPLELPTPVPVDGVYDLRPVIEAARAAAGCGFEDVDTDYWRVDVDWRVKRDTVAWALLANWLGVPASVWGIITPAESVTMAGAARVKAIAQLIQTPRGLWLCGLRMELHDSTSGGGLCVDAECGYVDRGTALRHAARRALGYLQDGREARYRRIIAELIRQSAELVAVCEAA